MQINKTKTPFNVAVAVCGAVGSDSFNLDDDFTEDTLASHDDVIDGDVDELHEEPDEAHDGETDGGGHGDLLELSQIIEISFPLFSSSSFPSSSQPSWSFCSCSQELFLLAFQLEHHPSLAFSEPPWQKNLWLVPSSSVNADAPTLKSLVEVNQANISL